MRERKIYAQQTSYEDFLEFVLRRGHLTQIALHAPHYDETILRFCRGQATSFDIVAIAIGIVPYARSLGTPEPPRGVAADHWVPMGDAAGFVITGDASDPKQGLRVGGSGQVKGYFMIRRGASWSRISNEPDEGVYKASVTR
jgi:hypothetical protein